MDGRMAALMAPKQLGIHCYAELRSRAILPLSNGCGTYSIFRASHSSGPVRYIPGGYSRKEGDGNPSFATRFLDQQEEWKPKLLADEDSLDLQAIPERSRLKNSHEGQTSASLSGILGDDKVLRFEDDDSFVEEDIDGDPMQEFDAQANKSGSSVERIVCEESIVCTNSSNRDASNVAIEVLAGRAHTVIELRKKLHGKKFSADVVESVISDFQSRGLLNDYLYAETFARSRWLSMTWGPRRIKQVLISKGISEEVAAKALKQVFEEDDSSDRYTRLGMSADSMSILFERVSKHWLRTVDLPEEKRKARIARWLQYRGFDWGLIAFIMKKLKA